MKCNYAKIISFIIFGLIGIYYGLYPLLTGAKVYIKYQGFVKLTPIDSIFNIFVGLLFLFLSFLCKD